MTDLYMSNKDEILAAGGAHLWPEVCVDKRCARMKSAMNALDNGGGLASWRKEWPSAQTLAGQKLQLQSGERFEPSVYKREQEEKTAAAMSESARALQYLQQMWAGKVGRKDERSRRAAWKSYMLQEAEATSREAKLHWCWCKGVRVISLQHDGIVVMIDGEGAQAQAAQDMARAATARCGFDVTVVPKQGRIWAS